MDFALLASACRYQATSPHLPSPPATNRPGRLRPPSPPTDFFCRFSTLVWRPQPAPPLWNVLWMSRITHMCKGAGTTSNGHGTPFALLWCSLPGDSLSDQPTVLPLVCGGRCSCCTASICLLLQCVIPWSNFKKGKKRGQKRC